MGDNKQLLAVSEQRRLLKPGIHIAVICPKVKAALACTVDNCIHSYIETTFQSACTVGYGSLSHLKLYGNHFSN